MTDNQQQIEESLETLQNDLEKALEWDVSDHDAVDTFMTAINLIKQGYRKVPENAVVLTQEEYNQLVNKLTRYKNKKAWAVTKEVCEEYRKETAKEIIQWLIDTGVINTAPDTIKMYFKEHFGVEANQ